MYKISNKEFSSNVISTFDKEYKKIPLSASISIKENTPITLHIDAINSFSDSIYNNLSVTLKSNIIPEKALNNPISKDRIVNQISKTGNTEFEFKNINIDLDEGLYIPSISKLNELRRNALEKLGNLAISNFTRKPIKAHINNDVQTYRYETPQISLLLNELNLDYDYSNIEKVDKIYIPFRYFLDKKYLNTINSLHSAVYIYMPSIIRENYKKLITSTLSKILNNFKISGFVISNLADLEFLPKNSDYEIIGNYTLNVFNNYTIKELEDLHINKITLSPELSKLSLTSNIPHNSELIVYGSTPVMTANYCLLGKTNHCYSDCTSQCKSLNKYYLKDRMGFNFRIIPDNIETVTTIYNSKITSIPVENLGFSSYRIDILDEDIEKINLVINTVKSGSRLEGSGFTNGNFNREV